MTLEQRRAAQAFRDVAAVAARYPEQAARERIRYGSMAQKLPVLIRTAGLCQALHFVHSRNKEELGLLLDHLAGQLARISAEITDRTSLCKQVREAQLPEYLWLTREALATAAWYARLAQSELKVPRGADPGDQG
jgi:CRISPR-associated protein Cmr5